MNYRFVTSARLRAGAVVLALALGPALVFSQASLPATAPAATASVSLPADTLISATSLSNASIIAPVAEPAVPRQPYGFRSVWAQGDGVARVTIVLLLIMSILSWYIIVAKLLEQRRLAKQSISAQGLLKGVAPMAVRVSQLPPGSPFHFLVESALRAVQRHASLARQIDRTNWLSQDIVANVTTLQMRAQDGLSVLATIGATAPFVGLFGTVWGIYHALVTIGLSGQASIEKVAGPVGEALIMTALGLAVAVPAVLGYNWLVRRNRVALHELRTFGSELHTQLLQEFEQQSAERAAAAQKD